MSNISSGNSSTAGAEEEYEEQDQQQTSNVLLPSSVHQEQDLPNKKRRKLPGNPGNFYCQLIFSPCAVVLVCFSLLLR